MDGGVSILLRGQLDSAGQIDFMPVWPDRSGIVVSGDATAALCTDANGDGRPDLLVAVNNGQVRSFQQQGENEHKFLSVHVQNQSGAPAIGTRVEVVHSDQSRQTAEVYAGSGYLSQSTHVLTFALGTNRTVDHVIVHWADGNVREYRDLKEKTVLRLRSDSAR